MTVTGPIRRFSVFDGTAWSQPKPAARMPRDGQDRMFRRPFADTPFPGLYVDAAGRVHMAWERDGTNCHAVIAELGGRPAAAAGRHQALQGLGQKAA